VQTRGPRFETKAEIKVLATYGNIVGMTGADEATLCKEAGLPYMCVCMVDNFANGVQGEALEFQHFKDGQKKNLVGVEKVVETILHSKLVKQD